MKKNKKIVKKNNTSLSKINQNAPPSSKKNNHTVLLEKKHLELVILRLSKQIIEKYFTSETLVLVGLQPRGIFLSKIIYDLLLSSQQIKNIEYAEIDVTFYRDDFKLKPLSPLPQKINPGFSVDNKEVVLIDDVLYTGRTVRAALDALQNYGRPQSIELMVLVNRRFSRQLPIEPNYSGISIDSFDNQKVSIEWTKDWTKSKVYLEYYENQ
ncbi:MAG: bifunctional pyr operon transcriptional regulator/uracil phosphoribosyltransferase PyrR [Bacteroidetes bacterium]|nr:MAG: bifunctional pyr operon transcriptional regulator/uracil phosphoribosyltransferase PyrR [Bacteroidota bacterium]